MEQMHIRTKACCHNQLKAAGSDRAALKRILLNLLDGLEDEEFRPNCLMSPKDAPPFVHSLLLPLFTVPGATFRMAGAMQAECGNLKTGTLIRLESLCLGIAQVFFEGRSAGAQHVKCFVAYYVLSRANSTDWMRSRTIQLAPMEAVVSALHFLELGAGRIRPCLPEDDVYAR